MLTPIQAGLNLIYQTSSGPITVTPYSFGYAELRNQPVVSEATLQQLTTAPPLPDGLFIAYRSPSALYVNHITDTCDQWIAVVDGEFIQRASSTTTNLLQYGLFASLDQIRLTFPEYFI